MLYIFKCQLVTNKSANTNYDCLCCKGSENRMKYQISSLILNLSGAQASKLGVFEYF